MLYFVRIISVYNIRSFLLIRNILSSLVVKIGGVFFLPRPTRKVNFPIVMRCIRKLIFGYLFLSMILICPQILKADVFDLSFSLTEGGYKLELTPENLYKGVNIRVNTDINTQYEVIHTWIKPLENRDDPGVLIRDNLIVRGLSGTNRYGNLRVPPVDSPIRFDEILYVSNATGSSDSFTLVYGIIRPEEISPGEYYGKIGFTLRPIGSSRQPETEILDVYITIREADTKQGIEITPVESLNTIILSTRLLQKNTALASVKINGRFDKMFSISQALSRPLESQEGNQLDSEAVEFEVSQVSKGMGVSQPQPLLIRHQTVYSSSPSGAFDADFIISYSLADISDQKAGNYSSRIQYLLDKMGVGQSAVGVLDLEVEIEPIFDLKISPKDQKGTLEFSDLQPKEPPRVNEVLIEVNSNIGKRYQITQNLYSNLTSKEGYEIPSEFFKFNTVSLDTKGTLKATAKQELKKGDTVLFISDTKGSSDNFRVIYELTSPINVKSGSYSTRITYSLSEL